MKYSRKWEKISEYSYRLKVPNGWIVLSERATGSSAGGRAVHTIFISDLSHSWELEGKED